MARLGSVVAGCLLVVLALGSGRAERAPAGLVGIPAAVAAAQCSVPNEGDVLQGAGPEVYLYAGGALHQVPDLATLRALGYDPNAIDPIRDECLRALRLGDPVPSARAAGVEGRTAASRAEAASQPTQSGPPVALTASATDVPRATSVLLTARADVPDSPGLVLSIQRTDLEGRGPASGLVTRCSGRSVCSVEVWEDRAITWTYVATLYHCPDPSACVAVQDSAPVSVTWR
jgi:hypothetical protein